MPVAYRSFNNVTGPYLSVGCSNWPPVSCHSQHMPDASLTRLKTQAYVEFELMFSRWLCISGSRKIGPTFPNQAGKTDSCTTAR
jgi:hypothetical protein